jgi:hypothetical protein
MPPEHHGHKRNSASPAVPTMYGSNLLRVQVEVYRSCISPINTTSITQLATMSRQ